MLWKKDRFSSSSRSSSFRSINNYQRLSDLHYSGFARGRSEAGTFDQEGAFPEALWRGEGPQH